MEDVGERECGNYQSVYGILLKVYSHIIIQ